MRLVVQFCNSTIFVFIKTSLNGKKLEALTRTEFHVKFSQIICMEEKENKHESGPNCDFNHDNDT